MESILFTIQRIPVKQIQSSLVRTALSDLSLSYSGNNLIINVVSWYQVERLRPYQRPRIARDRTNFADSTSVHFAGSEEGFDLVDTAGSDSLWTNVENRI